MSVAKAEFSSPCADAIADACADEDIPKDAPLGNIKKDEVWFPGLEYLFGFGNLVFSDSVHYEFEIPKKSGGTRLIEAPQERLKNIQRWIKDNIIDSFTPSEYAMGFRKGLSIVHNAEKHVGKELVINFDKTKRGDDMYFRTCHLLGKRLAYFSLSSGTRNNPQCHFLQGLSEFQLRNRYSSCFCLAKNQYKMP